jgi:hypothetical protein
MWISIICNIWAWTIQNTWTNQSLKKTVRLGFLYCWATWNNPNQIWTFGFNICRFSHDSSIWVIKQVSSTSWDLFFTSMIQHIHQQIQKFIVLNCRAYCPRHFSIVRRVCVIGWVVRAVLLTFPIKSSSDHVAAPHYSIVILCLAKGTP